MEDPGQLEQRGIHQEQRLHPRRLYRRRVAAQSALHGLAPTRVEASPCPRSANVQKRFTPNIASVTGGTARTYAQFLPRPASCSRWTSTLVVSAPPTWTTTYATRVRFVSRAR